uniref:Uncharacterized protein n=1 Tax=Anopheles merus TaxID=30066 RepID=A0A182VHQ4_ANOME
MWDHTGTGEADALLRRFRSVAVVCANDGGTTGRKDAGRSNDTVSCGQDEVIGQDGASAQTARNNELAHQCDLVRKLARRRFLPIGDAVRWTDVPIDLQLLRQTLPVVIELLDRAHPGPVDLDPFGAGNGSQAGNEQYERLHLATE